MAENKREDRLEPTGNLTVLKIHEEEGEGLIITWVGNYKPTLVDCIGDEKPVYDWIKQKYGDLNKATGDSLNLLSEDGKLMGIGERGQGASALVIQRNK